MSRGLNVLSLCDGMSCGRMAFEKVGIPVAKYYASEIKDIAIKATKHNFPDTIHVGDVHKIRYENGVLHTENGDYKTAIDIVIFGSPCQSWSNAMKADRKVGLEDPTRSGLFYECERVLREVKPKYFLMENVVMPKVDADIVSQMLGVQPLRINSALVSAQLRDRYYWTNIPNVTVPDDKQITLTSILSDGYTPYKKSKCLRKNDSHGFYNGCNWTGIKRFYRWYYKSFGDMVFPDKESFDKCLCITKDILQGRKATAALFDGYSGTAFDCARYFTKEERARLQTVPEKYVACMTEKEAADLLGDGWTVDVIAHIFLNICTGV